MQPLELRRLSREYDRMLERDLTRDRPRLFKALTDFVNIRDDKEGWAYFRKRWPDFFPRAEYDKAEKDSEQRRIREWLNQIWIGGETEPYLEILLGIEHGAESGTPEDAWTSGDATIGAKFYADWDEGIFRYEGACDFQRALYLLFRESWKARICESCSAKFIARRAAQKYCSTDCSETMQREVKRKWWAEHGDAWRRARKVSISKKKGRSKWLS